MRKDNNIEFDEQIRSILDAGQEEVPAGVWEAVSTRLDRRHKRIVAWRWSAAGLAAAASLAVALVMTGTFGHRPSEPLAGEQYVADLVENTTPSPVESIQEALPVEEAVAVEQIRKTAVAPARTSVSAEQAEMREEAEVTAGTEGCVTATTQEKTDAVGQKAPEAQKEQKTESQKWSDPFARMAYEDAKAKSRPGASFSVNGLVGTNDGAKFGNGNYSVRATAGALSRTVATTAAEDSEPDYGVPFSVGIGARFYFSDRWSVGTGLNYSLLSRNFAGIYTKTQGGKVEKVVVSDNIRHTVQYVGVPVNIYFDILSNNAVNLYSFAGATGEKGISQKYTINGKDATEIWKQSVDGMQWSAAVGLGVQFRISDHLGIYVDPSARYYFDCAQPKSIRTQQPLMFNLEAGLRFNL